MSVQSPSPLFRLTNMPLPTIPSSYRVTARDDTMSVPFGAGHGDQTM